MTANKTIAIPDLALVVLVGPSGSGKSTFAARHFSQSEVLSSDFCRLLVADDENDQSATAPAFEVLHYIASKRLDGGRLTVIDATNVQRDSRASLLRLARDQHVLPVAIVLKVDEKICAERNAARADRDLPNIRYDVSTVSSASRSKGCGGKGSVECSFLTAPKRSTLPPSCESVVGATTATTTGPLTSSATFMAAPTNLSHS